MIYIKSTRVKMLLSSNRENSHCALNRTIELIPFREQEVPGESHFAVA